LEADDELEIRRLLARLAQAIDDRNETGYLACLANQVHVDELGSESRRVEAKAYARDAVQRAARTDWTHHKLTNPVIHRDRDPDRATAVVDVVIDLAWSQKGGSQKRATIGGRYLLGFVRLGGAWRVDQRVFRRRYAEGDDRSAPE
jgi:hypothetical protein